MKKYSRKYERGIDEAFLQWCIDQALNEWWDYEGTGVSYQIDCAWAAAHILFIASDGNHAKANLAFDEWKNTDDAQDTRLKAFVEGLTDALGAIEKKDWKPSRNE